jgi:ABC-type nickel/cobalt efflux system permease component RcnA
MYMQFVSVYTVNPKYNITHERKHDYHSMTKNAHTHTLLLLCPALHTDTPRRKGRNYSTNRARPPL